MWKCKCACATLPCCKPLCKPIHRRCAVSASGGQWAGCTAQAAVPSPGSTVYEYQVGHLGEPNIFICVNNGWSISRTEATSATVDGAGAECNNAALIRLRQPDGYVETTRVQQDSKCCSRDSNHLHEMFPFTASSTRRRWSEGPFLQGANTGYPRHRGRSASGKKWEMHACTCKSTFPRNSTIPLGAFPRHNTVLDLEAYDIHHFQSP